MKSTSWPTALIRVVDLRLDPANVRLASDDISRSQGEILQDLFFNQDAFKLLRNIAKSGWFQHEMPIVTKEDGEYVVLEGNRRVAALKAAMQPGLVPSHAAKIEHLNETSSHLPLVEIEVKIAPSRAAAAELLAIVHTTENRKPWAPLRQAYFYYAQLESKARTLEELIEDFPEVDIPRFIKMWEMHHIVKSIPYDLEEQSEKVFNQYRFPISTFERLYNTDAFQSHFGITFSPQGRAIVKSEPESLKQCLKPVIVDILDKTFTSRTYNKSTDIADYLSNAPRPDIRTASQGKSSSAFKPEKPTTAKRPPVGLIPKDVSCSLNPPGIRKVLKELQDINYKKFPNAAHDLLRSFLECSLKAYFKHVGISVPAGKSGYVQLADILLFAQGHFSKTNRELEQTIKVIRASAGDPTKDYFKSADFLNAVNHNPSVFSVSDQVKQAWDSMDTLIRFILNP